MPGTPFQLSDDALKRIADMVTQNLMRMQQQSAPPGPPEGDAASSQEGLSERRKQELLEMQQAAKQRREASWIGSRLPSRMRKRSQLGKSERFDWMKGCMMTLWVFPPPFAPWYSLPPWFALLKHLLEQSLHVNSVCW